MINGKSISLSELPSKGLGYPNKDFEIFVKPLTIREEMTTSLERLGSSKSSYFDNLMDSIEIRGSFDKKDLLYIDIQYIDLGRRLFSFELDEEIEVKEGVKCKHCGKLNPISFQFNEVVFEDLDESNFGKELVFSDGLKIKIKPVSMRRFQKVVREFLTNSKDDAESISNYVMAYRASSVYEVIGEDNIKREYKSLDEMHKFMFDYLSNLYKYKDNSILEELDLTITSKVIPFKRICSSCEKEQEVAIEPTMRFHQ